MQLNTDKMIARKNDGVGWMIFNNPERRNAVSMAMWEAVGNIISEFASDDEVRVVVMSGAGDRAFVSGADISEFAENRNSAEAEERYSSATAQAHKAMAAFQKPLIAMIQGYCIGGGVAVAMAADIRIAADDTQYSVPAARLGLGYGYSGLNTLVSLVGPAMAKEIFFTARRYSAEEALAMGLVNRVVPADQLENVVAEYTAMITENAPLTNQAAKSTVREILKNPENRDLKSLEAQIKACFDSEDFTEGRTAFMEKRKPNFQGR